ncbi:DUF6600 domain-containing protein [Roseateles sp. BYS78W]|uniref:DUF6600 domain-containing protein n=1 Tax=Pelomonas candidula TaxID=3299025 RepID=A0ABW7HAX9_9BURK
MTTSLESKLVLSRRRWRMLALALLVAAAPAVKAQDADRDPPTRAARVVDVIGDAWLFDHDSREWTRLTRNQTVGEGDRVRTDDRGRVSLRVGSTTVWVDERSDLELSQLDEGQTLLQLDRGDLALRLRSAENAAETRVRTREGSAQAEREGLYRVEQLDRGSKVYVFQGRLRFDWARAASPVVVGTGEQVELWWPDGPRAERGPLYSDGFGDWVLAENREEGDRPVARYVSPEMTGAEDLDRYGRWETAPDYGAVWIPTTVVAVDWAPYRYGHWAWSRLWGWTWVDDAPWGFAPFHYGRWVNWGGRWCWAPGAYVHRPVYAPALVGWVGGGSVSVGISIGGGRTPPPRYGWYPLAPREVFVPAYHHSPRYETRVNDPRDLRDPVTVQRPHRYRDVPTAVSVLPATGGAIQPMPVVRGPDRKAEPGWVRPLPVAPGRGELAGALPAVPVRPVGADVQRPRERERDAATGWRSDNQLPVRRDPPNRGAEVTRPGVPVVAPQVQQQPQQPVRPAVEQPQRGTPENWGAQREQQRRDEMLQREQAQRAAQQRDAQQREIERQQQQREAQQRDQLQRDAQQRDMQQRREAFQQQQQQQQREMPQRREEPRVQIPQPQAQMPQQRGNDGPQRGRQDGVPARQDKPREREARPNERQQER